MINHVIKNNQILMRNEKSTFVEDFARCTLRCIKILERNTINKPY